MGKTKQVKCPKWNCHSINCVPLTEKKKFGLGKGLLGGAVNAKGPYLANGINLGTQIVVRGGSWNSVASECRAACRDSLAPASVGDAQDVGMRIACRNGLK